jgi:hypothetical protein
MSAFRVTLKYVLVMYGEKYAQTEHPLGLTITAARTVSELSFLTAVHDKSYSPSWAAQQRGGA